MGIIEDLFGDDSILATSVDRVVLDSAKNCEGHLVPKVPPTSDEESWGRYHHQYTEDSDEDLEDSEKEDTDECNQEAVAATLLVMENIKKNGDNLNEDSYGDQSKLVKALYRHPTLDVSGRSRRSYFKKNADAPFSSNDNDLRNEIFHFISAHDQNDIICQLNLESDEFITYLIDSVRTKLESNDTKLNDIYPIVDMSVIDFSRDLVLDDEWLAKYSIYIDCKLADERYDDDDDDDESNNECRWMIRILTYYSTIQTYRRSWLTWKKKNPGDAERAVELREKFMSQYGPGHFVT